MHAIRWLACLAVIIASSTTWADVTVTTSVEIHVSPLLPRSMADPMEKQLASQLPGKSVSRMKGNKVSMVVDGSLGIIDYGKNTITLIDAANRQYVTVPLAGFTTMAEASANKQDDVPKATVEGLKSSADVKKTGQRLVIQDIQTEETLVTLNVDAPNSPNFPGGVKMEMRFWLAMPSEVQRLPALKELAAFAARARGPMNSLEVIEQIAKPFPGLGETLRAPMKAILQSSGPALKMQIRIFSPMLQQLTELIRLSGQPLPPGADPSGPLAEINFLLGGLSGDAIPDSAVDIPAGYQAMAFGGGAK
jgi:hypothetical protein